MIIIVCLKRERQILCYKLHLMDAQCEHLIKCKFFPPTVAKVAAERGSSECFSMKHIEVNVVGALPVLMMRSSSCDDDDEELFLC